MQDSNDIEVLTDKEETTKPLMAGTLSACGAVVAPIVLTFCEQWSAITSTEPAAYAIVFATALLTALCAKNSFIYIRNSHRNARRESLLRDTFPPERIQETFQQNWLDLRDITFPITVETTYEGPQAYDLIALPGGKHKVVRRPVTENERFPGSAHG